MNHTLENHFLNLYSIALSDKDFDERELETLYKIASDKGVPKEEIDAIILNPSTIQSTYPDTVSEKVIYLYDYAKMVLADDKIEQSEITSLEKFCRLFGFKDENISAIVDLLLSAAKDKLPTQDLIKFVLQNSQ